MAFFATSVDDFCVLLIFFSREYDKTEDLGDESTQRAFTNIIIGQFVGFTIIVSVSLAIGIGLSQTVDEDWIDLIGFIPMLIGMYLIYELMTEAGYFDHCCPETDPENSSDLEQGSDAEEKSPLVNKIDQGLVPGKGGIKRVTIDERSSATNPEDTTTGPAAIPAVIPHPKTKKHVSYSDEEAKERPADLGEAAGGGSSGDSGGGGDSGSNNNHASNPGRFYTDDDSDVEAENQPKPKAKPRRKRTLSADLSGRYFESLNDRIDVSNALGEAMGENKSGKSQSVFSKWITCFLDPLSQEVILYVLIFGIDNLAIFTVLFANVTEIEIVVVVVVFYALLFFYIALTILVLLQCPIVGHWFGNNVRYLVPFVLIGFGIYILYGSVIWCPNEE